VATEFFSLEIHWSPELYPLYAKSCAREVEQCLEDVLAMTEPSSGYGQRCQVRVADGW
jgi:hypothetical protein